MAQTPSQCPACGTLLSGGGGSEGLCPACLLELALESPSTATEPGGPEQVETLVAGDSVLAKGSVLGNRYRVRSLLGRGGMGEVWRAFDLKLRVDVALKALHTGLLADDRALELLRQEVRSAREVVSPNVCRVFDLEELEGAELVSMEYVDGSTLREVLDERSPLELEEAREIASQFLAGLEAIHAAGLVHRDIKPDNLMITRTGRVVVMDFGLAKALAGAWRGSISGTPAYMAPEHARGDVLDARADVYAAAFVLAEMVDPGGVRTSGARKGVLDGLRATPPVVADTPWATILEQAVAVDPDHRQDTAAVLARALDEITVRTAGDEELRPYPGLSSFTSADSEYFFGRELEVERMWRKLRRPHLLALIGPSGSGKSSFLRAGLLAAAPPGWRVLIAQPGNRPMIALGRALVAELSGDSDVAEDFLRFDEPEVALSLFARWRERHGQVLLIIDQFEELFTQNAEEDQDRFADLLRRLSLEVDVHVLLTLRDDFLYRCASHEALAPVLSELTLLKTLSGASLRRALLEPALKCGYRFEDERLVEEMLAEVSDERGALPLVAFAAAKLWELRDRERGLLVREAYEEIGGVGGALAQHAEDTLETIGSDRVPLVRDLFRNLVTPDGTRATRERGELLSLFEGKEREAADRVVGELIDARLLTSYDETDAEDEEQGASYVEIIHESLLSAWPRLVRWQTQDADSAQMREQVRRAAAVWNERDRSVDLLWTGTAYREFEVWHDAYPGRLTEIEQAFAGAMVRLAERTKRRRRIALAAGFAVLLGVLAVVGGLWRQALEEARRAEANVIVSVGRDVLEQDPSEALAYALASLDLSDQESARLLALEALWNGPTALRQELEQPARAAMSLEGEWIAVGSHFGEIWLLSRAGESREVVTAHAGEVGLLGFLSMDTLVSYSFADKHVRLWSVPDLAPEGTLAVDGALGFRIVPDSEGQLGILTWERAGAVRLWSAAGESTSLGSVDYRSIALPEQPWDTPWAFDPVHRVFVYPKGQGIYKVSLAGTERKAERIAIAPLRAQGFAISPDGKTVGATFDKPPGVAIWSLEPPYRQLPLSEAPTGMSPDPAGIAFSPDGSRLAAAGESTNFYLWDLKGPPHAEPLILNRRGTVLPRGVSFSADGDWLLTVQSSGSDLWPLGRDYGSVLRKRGGVWGVAAAPDGSWIAASGPEEARIWPARRSTALETRPLEGPDVQSLRIAASSDGSTIAIGHRTGRVRVFTPSGASSRTRQPTSGEGGATTLRFHPDDLVVATADGYTDPAGAFVHIWNLETDEEIELDPEHGNWISYVAFTEDGRLIESSLHSLGVWDVSHKTRRLLREGAVHDGQPGPDGNSIVFLERTSHFQGIPRRIDIESGRELPIAEWGIVGGLTVTDNGEMIGSTASGIIQVGPLTGGRPHLLFRHEGSVMSIAEMGNEIVTGGGEDGTIRIWPRPNLEETPFHLLPHEELLAKLRALTNIRVVRDEGSETGYRTEIGEFPGWEVAPTW